MWLQSLRILCNGAVALIRPINATTASSQLVNCLAPLTCTTALRTIATSAAHSNTQHEPPYLTDAEPTAFTYPLINIQMRGYDYTVLQGYQKWITKAAEHLDLTVSDNWAVPCKKLNVTSLKAMSDVVEESYTYNIYERNVQISNLPATLAPLLLETIQAAQPEGVELCVDHHNPEIDETRYIPNSELKQLRKELDEIDNPLPQKTFVKKTAS